MAKRTYQQYTLSRLKMTEDECRMALIELFGELRQPVALSYGLGVDSTATLIGMKQRGERPDLIKFANTGRPDFTRGEKRATYAYLDVINRWCADNGFPLVTVLHKNSKDESLYDECWRKSMLPSIAYGGHSCSDKWKQAVLEKFSNNWLPARLAWGAGFKMVRIIGYDASPRDCARMAKAVTYVAKKDDVKHEYRYPLQEWGWDRERCMNEILAAGLPLPPKSSCTFCTAMKREEVIDLRRSDPDEYYANLALEQRAIASGQLKSSKGLGRSYAWADIERDLVQLERAVA